MENFQSVFDAYPDTQTIYVVGEMPFLQASHAESHSRTTGVPVRAINRPSKGQVEPPGDPKTPVDPGDPKTPVDPGDPKTPVDPVDRGKPAKTSKGKK